MSKNRKKQQHQTGGSTAPAQRKNVIDPKKLVKVSKEEVKRLSEYNQSIKMIEARLGTIRAAYLDDEAKGMKYRKMEANKRMMFVDELKKKYSIIGNVIGVDDKTNELILE